MVVGIERITTAAATPARPAESSAAAVAAPAGCSFAQAGTGTFASTLCWLDLSAYNPNSASKPAGQPMTVTLPGGYTITFNLHVSGGPVAATSFPTFTDAFLGNNGFYTGVSGRPALNQTTRGTTTTATLTGITVTGPGGTPETGYAFVGADAESTDRQESITWTANTPFTLLEPVGNACNSGSRLTGVGTKTVTCAATVTNTKTGTAMLAAQAPSSIAQEMVGGGRQGVAFGVLVSTVQLSKQVSSRIDPSDAFGISIRSLPSNDLLGSANTGTANTASTGPITVLTSDVGPASRSQSRSPPGFHRTTRSRGRVPETAPPIRVCRPATSDPRRRSRWASGTSSTARSRTRPSLSRSRCRRTRGCPPT